MSVDYDRFYVKPPPVEELYKTVWVHGKNQKQELWIGRATELSEIAIEMQSLHADKVIRLFIWKNSDWVIQDQSEINQLLSGETQENRRDNEEK